MAAAGILVAAAVVAPVLDLSAAAHATLVNQARAALVQSGSAVRVAQPAAATNRRVDTARRWATRKRDAGRLVLVKLPDASLLVPTVQLNEAFDLNERVADRTQRLIEWGMGPWAIWDWWHTPNGWLLDGQSPADAVGAGDFGALDRAIDGLVP